MSGLESTGLLLGISGPLQQLREGYISLRNRCEYCQTNSQEAAAVLRRSVETLSELQSLEASLLRPHRDSQPNYTQDQDQFFGPMKKRLQEVNERLHLIQERLKIQKPLWRFVRATSTKADISKLEEEVEVANDKVNNFQAFAMLQEGTLLRFLHVTGNMNVSRGAPGTTPVAICNVPQNQTWVRLDFDSLTPSGVPVTMEGQMLSLLMRGAKGKCSIGIDQTVLHVTSDPGCGKSCSVRGLVSHPAIVKQYLDNDGMESSANEIAGGVYYFKLSADVKETEINALLAAAVERAGGWDIAKRVALADQLFDAVYLVYSWFKNRSCVFIFDDALDDHPLGIEIALQLANLSRCSYSSAVLFTRKRRILTDTGDHVHFSITPTGAYAKQYFLRQAGLTEENVQDAVSAKTLNKILGICNGKLTALNTSANCVRLMRGMSEQDLGDTLSKYLSRYEATQECEQYNQVESESTTHFRMISITIDVLVERAKLTGPEYLTKIKTFFISLCTLQSGEWVAYSALQRYWGLREKQDVEKVCHLLNDGCLGCSEKRQVTGRNIDGFRIHDRKRRYCICEAEHMNVGELWSIRRSTYIAGVPET